MAKVKITEIAESVLADFLAENELELYNIEFAKEGKDWFLRVYIDKPQGSSEEYVCIDECELVSRFLSDKLDELDPIEQNYYLEVSSPGLDRQLVTEAHYTRYTGKAVEVSLYKAYDGKKNYEGVLLGLEDGVLSLEIAAQKKGEESKKIDIPFDQVAKTKLAVIF